MPENALPALANGPYFSRGNVPMGSNNTTQLLMHQWYCWSLFSFLVDSLTGGSTSGTRHANSVWTIVRTCDSVSVSTSDLLGASAFNAAKWVRNTSGSAHSWAHLRNATNGYDCVIALCNPANGTIGIRFIKTSAGVTTGTTTVAPVGSAGEEFLIGVTSIVAGTSAVLWGDFVTGNVNYSHFVIDDDGHWLAFSTRSGLGVGSSFIGLWPALNGRADDTRNVWALWGGSSLTGRGIPSYSTFASGSGVSALRRGHLGATPATTYGVRSWSINTTAVPGLGADPLTTDGDFLSVPVEVGMAVTSAPVSCGVLADLYFVSGGTVGSPVPAEPPGMERLVLGDMVIPFGVLVAV